jgi:hypothetical protein
MKRLFFIGIIFALQGSVSSSTGLNANKAKTWSHLLSSIPEALEDKSIDDKRMKGVLFMMNSNRF